MNSRRSSHGSCAHQTSARHCQRPGRIDAQKWSAAALMGKVVATYERLG